MAPAKGLRTSCRRRRPERGTPVEARARTNELLLLSFLATVVMLFAAFTAAYLIRRTAADWGRIALPRIFWVNTVILVASSGTIELARRRADRRWLFVTTVLGLLFLGGQLVGWRTMAENGVVLPTHPHSAFIYMLTAVHGLHLLGGLAVLIYVTLRATTVRLCATYWHFVDAVWIYLLVMLTVL